MLRLLSLGYFIILLLIFWNECTNIYRDLGKDVPDFIPRGQKRDEQECTKQTQDKSPLHFKEIGQELLVNHGFLLVGRNFRVVECG